MDVAYNPHAERSRRKNRSSTNVNHLSLAPLTSKLPIRDADALPIDSAMPPSYFEGKSAPTTPRFITHTPATPRSRSQHRRTPSAPDGLLKSKSASHLAATKKGSRSGTSTPKRRRDDILQAARHANDSDWMLRTGAVVSTEAREFKGQAWLVSRQSSTSLAAYRDPNDDPFEQELLREREMVRRGSSAFGDDDTTSPVESRHHSRFASRHHSVTERERSSALQTPLHSHGNGESYFPEAISGPDFVNLDEKLEELERDTDKDDEAAIRKLLRDGQTGKGSWLTNMIAFNLFRVDEHDDSDEEDSDDDEDEQPKAGMQTPRVGDGITMLPATKMPLPSKGDGAWSDAAWLLSVASKVMF